MRTDHRTRPDGARRQRGAAVWFAGMLLLAAAWAVMATGRLVQLQESQLGGALDQARAMAAAQALIRDAETDVRGHAPDGTPCHNPVPAVPGCRDPAAGPALPYDAAGHDRLRDALGGDPATLRCRQGICLPPDGSPHAATVSDALPTLMSGGTGATHATYGQYSGAGRDNGRHNPYLDRSGYYWIEVLPYAVGTGIAGTGAGTAPVPGPDRPYLFRITALVHGLRPGTRVVLQEIFVPAPLAPA